MKRIIVFIALCFFIQDIQSQEITNTYQFTLKDCINYAFSNSYERQNMILSKESKDVMFGQSKQEMLPSLSASASESLSNNESGSTWAGSVGLNTSVVIYQGGTIRNTIEQNKLNVEKAELQVSQYDNELVIRILQAFLTVLCNEELLKYQEVVLKTSLEQMNQGKEKYKLGAILESDYYMLESQYASDSNNILDTRILRNNSILQLKSLLSMDPTKTLQIIYPDTTIIERISVFPTQDEAVAKAIEYLPDLKIDQYNIEIAQKNIDLSRASYYPSINLNGGISTGHNDFDAFGTQFNDRLGENIGVSLSVPIFNKNRTKSQITQSKIALQQAELEQKQSLLNIRQTIIQEYQDVVSAYNSYNASKIKQMAYLKTFEAYNSQFRFGSITAVDLLQQQNNYINALNEYIQDKYGFILKRKILDVYMGNEITM